MGTEIPTRDEMLKRLDNYERVAIALRHLGAGELGDAERHVVAGLDALYAALASREPQPALVVKPEHISRVELIDHRRSVARGGGRQFTAYDVSVELQYQDDGRTLKVFVDNRTALSERRANGEAPITDSLGSGK